MSYRHRQLRLLQQQQKQGWQGRRRAQLGPTVMWMGSAGKGLLAATAPAGKGIVVTVTGRPAAERQKVGVVEKETSARAAAGDMVEGTTAGADAPAGW